MLDWIPAYAGMTFAAFLLAFSASAAAFSIQVPDFDRLESQLKLRAAQKEQFDVAVSATQRALLAVAIAGLQAKERLTKEFSKPLPDLYAIYRVHEEAIAQTAPALRETRDEWEKLYATMDAEQVAAAKRFIREQLGLLVLPWR